MNALAIDSAQTCLTIAAKKGGDKVTLSLDISMKQAQKILPGIQAVLEQLELDPKELDYLALTSGPGTFTGLRLSFAALKAIELSAAAPLYSVPTLDAYAFPYSNFEGMVVSVIDAKKDQFFASVYEKGRNIRAAEDTDAKTIADFIKTAGNALICGPDCHIFAGELLKVNPDLRLTTFASQAPSTDAVFAIAEEKIQKKEPPMKDYDGPEYLRKSEAEIVLESKQNQQ